MEKFIVTLGGIGLIAGIYWFFFGKKEKSMEVTDSLTIIVDGGYKPNTIRIKQGETVKLTFIRKDTNSCLEEIVFPDFKIKEFLPMNEPVTVTLSPSEKGSSVFHCAMNMFHGMIEIV